MARGHSPAVYTRSSLRPASVAPLPRSSSLVATTHISSNHGLASVGDAVLQMCAVQHLLATWPNASFEQLETKLHYLVSNVHLEKLSRQYGMDKWVAISKSFSGTGPTKNILTEAFEATLGAAYIDGGMGSAYDIYINLMPKNPWAEEVPTVIMYREPVQQRSVSWY